MSEFLCRILAVFRASIDIYHGVIFVQIFGLVYSVCITSAKAPVEESCVTDAAVCSKKLGSADLVIPGIRIVLEADYKLDDIG